MNCDDVRSELLHYQRGQLSTLHRNDIRVHLQGCPACAHEVAATRCSPRPWSADCPSTPPLSGSSGGSPRSGLDLLRPSPRGGLDGGRP